MVDLSDEAHRGQGDYSYVLLERLLKDQPHRVLALSATPGNEMSKIQDVC